MDRAFRITSARENTMRKLELFSGIFEPYSNRLDSELVRSRREGGTSRGRGPRRGSPAGVVVCPF
jgi:hypothetical protein